MNKDFQIAGEECTSCKDRWVGKKMPVRKLVALPAVTEVYHAEVAVCSYCDGEPIIEFATANSIKEE